MSKKVLIIGNRGREHAIGWKLKQSSHVKKLYFAPGNAGTSELGINIPLQITEIKKLAKFAKENQIFLTIVGSDEPLALGIVDYFQKQKLKIFGPTKKAAQIEWSKTFAKNLMKKSGIPTASFKSFTDFKVAKKYLESLPYPIFIKASGLAEGKGAIRCETKKQAEKILSDMLIKKLFGKAGSAVVIEELLIGEEVSIHAFSDGKTISLFPTAQDNKAIYDGGKGPNTGGIGTIAPVPSVNKSQQEEIKNSIVLPTLQALKKSGRTFIGNLYPGLMMTETGPKVIEFNARFGDPEMESYMRLLKTDLFEICMACIGGKLAAAKIQWAKQSSCCIVLTSRGYPGKYKKDRTITGIGDAEKIPGVKVFHFATKRVNGKLVTNGGRVLGVTATDRSLHEALKKAYKAVSKISFKGMHYRKDIGKKYR